MPEFYRRKNSLAQLGEGGKNLHRHSLSPSSANLIFRQEAKNQAELSSPQGARTPSHHAVINSQPIRVLLTLLSLFLISHVTLTPALADEEDTLPRLTAMAMHGTPKYNGTSPFPYVNPDAPKGGTLRLGVTGTFDSLNPFIIRGQVPYGLPTGNFSLVYESLMARGWDEPFTLYGLLAESVQVPNNRAYIIFNLNPNARWQDGQSVTAEDILFSFQILRDHGRPNHRTYYKKVEQAEQLDSLRVRFSFLPDTDGTWNRELPMIMGMMPVLPRHAWQGREFDKTTLKLPLGSGAYKITAVEAGRSVTYERNATYWGRDLPVQRGLYNFDQIRVDFYRDDSVAMQAFVAGQYDLRREPDPVKWVTVYGDAPNIVRETLPHRRTEAAQGFIFNTRRQPLDDPHLREAMGLAFDSEWINRSLFHGRYRRTMGFFPNSELSAFDSADDDLKPEQFRADLLRAVDILKQAGYVLRDNTLYAPRNGNPVAFTIMLSDPAEEKLALEWIRGLKRLGIKASARVVDSAQYQARLAEFDFDVTVGKWFNSLSPGNEQAVFWSSAAAAQNGSRNYAGVRDSQVDAIVQAIPRAADRAELVALTQKLDRLLVAGHYVVPFYYLGQDQIAWWKNRLSRPAYTPLYGAVMEAWWSSTN